MTLCARCGHPRNVHKLVHVQDEGPMGRAGDLSWPERLHCLHAFCICLQFVWPKGERRVLVG